MGDIVKEPLACISRHWVGQKINNGRGLVYSTRQLLLQPHVLLFLLPLDGHINPFLHLGEQLSTFHILLAPLVLGPLQLASNGTLQTQSHPTHQFKWNKGNTYYVPIPSNKRNTFLKSWWWCECCHFVVTLGIIQWHCLLLWVSLSLSVYCSVLDLDLY